MKKSKCILFNSKGTTTNNVMNNTGNGYVSLSIVMNGIKKCSGGCLYCSAASTMNYRSKDNETTFVIDKENLRKTLDNHESIIAARNMPTKTVHIDIWGGNPLENFGPFKETVDFLHEYFVGYNYDFCTSGNGLELQSDDFVQYLIDNNIHYQLSHDGLGQWMRTGEIDPLYWDKTKDNVAKLARLGNLYAINATLNRYNYSFFKNIEYFNKWRREIGIMGQRTLNIKLNHIYDGTPDLEAKNIFGHWQDGYREDLKGTVIGSLSFRGKVLDEYLHEFKMLYEMLQSGSVANSDEYSTYTNYILEQAGRWRELNGEDDLNAGSCRNFQRGLIKQTFVIDTKGKYSQCNLIDSDITVKNPGGYQPEYCRECRFRMQSECNPCGSEPFAKECEFHYKWCLLLEEINCRKQYSGKSSCNGNCNCNKPQEFKKEITISCENNFSF